MIITSIINLLILQCAYLPANPSNIISITFYDLALLDKNIGRPVILEFQTMNIFRVIIHVPNILWNMDILQICSFILNSNWTESPVFLFALSGNVTWTPEVGSVICLSAQEK